MEQARRSSWHRLRGYIARSPVGADEGSFSERIRQTIDAQQHRSEMLIGWLQLAVVMIFGSLYLVSPKISVAFDPVPWVLAIYLVLTIVRLIWGRLARLPDWSLVISVAFDVALLMTLIWSFHLKYEQPASFYLKAPTLLYVFIFIALRALRFEARFVLIAGGAAALGWMALIVYALLGGDEAAPITRNYVVYLTSNSVLIGAEIDKIVSILMVTAIIAVAIQRARRLMVQAVVEQTAVRDLSRFFAPEVAAKITASAMGVRVGTGELRDAAILNIDMRGFTRFAAEAAPDAVMRVLAEYQAATVPIIRRHGGIVDKFLGDGILATFGTVRPSLTYAADALRALEEVVVATEAIPRRADEGAMAWPVVNGAVATGPVLFGAVGAEDRLEYTVIGEAVNLSARIEKANKRLGTKALCDEATYALACAQGYTRGAGIRRYTVELPGIAVPVTVVSLVPRDRDSRRLSIQ